MMGILMIPIVLAGLLALHFLPPLVLRWVHTKRLRRRSRGSLVLTFDDGPDEDLTPRLLDLLAAEGVHATFYMVGVRAAEGRRQCDRLAAEGKLSSQRVPASQPIPGTSGGEMQPSRPIPVSTTISTASTNDS